MTHVTQDIDNKKPLTRQHDYNTPSLTTSSASYLLPASLSSNHHLSSLTISIPIITLHTSSLTNVSCTMPLLSSVKTIYGAMASMWRSDIVLCS